jgi:uncharacterized protein
LNPDIERASINTFTGKRFFLLEPIIKDIDIRDIAHALAMQCRWTGHSKYHYSVAQHSVYCSQICPKKYALRLLLHDASEAYISDISRPLKHYTNAGIAYRRQEKIIQDAVMRRFGLPIREPAIVHEVDNQVLFTEREQLMSNFNWDESLSIHEDFGKADIKIRKWTPEHAERMFLKRFKELYKGE